MTETRFECTCPSCDKEFRFTQSKLGKKAKCNKCDSLFRVTPDDVALKPATIEQPVFTPMPHYEQIAPQPSPQIVHVHNNYQNDKKSKAVAILLWFFLGGFGIHRFYLGDNGSGAAILVSFIIVMVTLGAWLIIHVPLVLLDGLLLAFDRRKIYS